jgi:hypothetical protein
MIAQYHQTKRGLAMAVTLLAGLAVATLTDAQTGGNPPVSTPENNAFLSD